MRFTFAYPWILYLLWSVPLWGGLLFYLRQRRHNKITGFTGPTLASKLIPAENSLPARLQIMAALAAITLLLLAAAGPRSTQRHEQEVAVRGRDLVLLLDVSRSMLANDVHPSRLVRAKADMLDILEELRPGDRIALVAFRNRATRITPFTTDQRFLRQAITGLSIHSAPAGKTDIGAAIQMARTVFDDDSPAHKAVIMISDGEDLTGEAIDAAQAAGRQRIPFFTVGLGSRAGSTIPDSDSPRGVFLHEGEPVITRLEEASLVTLARLTGGAYIPVETASVGAVTLGERIREHLRAVEVQAYATIETGDHAERFAYFLFPAILLLMLAGGFSQGQLRTTTRRLALLILLLAASRTAHAEAPPPENSAPRQHRVMAREAQARQREGNFSAAAARYMEAADQPEVPARTSDRYRYNAAIAALQAGDHETATTLLGGLPPIHQTNLARALAQFKQGEQAADGSADGYRQRLEQWAEAARLLQQSWQQAGAPEVEQDLQTLDSIIPAAERDASRADILERYADKSPDDMAWQMLQAQRRQHETTDRTPLPPIGPERLRHFEDLARQRKELAEQYLALSQHLQAAGAPQDNIQPLLNQQTEVAQQAENLRDLVKPDAADPVELGHPLYNTWRTIGAPETLLSESLRQQEWLQNLSRGNAAQQPPVPLAALQSEAASLTDLFAERFQPPPDTEPENIEQIQALTEEAGRLQRLAAEMLALDDTASAREVQEDALNALRKLSELLPQPPPDDSEQQQDEEPDPDPPEPPDGDPDGDPGESPEMVPPPPDDPDDGEAEEDTETPPEEPEEEMEDDTFDLDALIEQVEQRAQEYRDRVEQRQQGTRQPGRDW